MTLKASFLVTLLLSAFKLPVAGLGSDQHVAVDAIGKLPSDYVIFLESIGVSCLIQLLATINHCASMSCLVHTQHF